MTSSAATVFSHDVMKRLAKKRLANGSMRAVGDKLIRGNSTSVTVSCNFVARNKTYHTCKFSSAGKCFWIFVANSRPETCTYFSTPAYYVASNMFKYTTTPSPRSLLCALLLNLTLRQKSIVLEPWLVAVNLPLRTNDLHSQQLIHCKLVIPRPTGG